MRSLMPVSLLLSGFPAGQQETLHTQMPNYLGCTWTSHAAFVTDAQVVWMWACKDLSFGPNSTVPAKRLLSVNTFVATEIDDVCIFCDLI